MARSLLFSVVSSLICLQAFSIKTKDPLERFRKQYRDDEDKHTAPAASAGAAPHSLLFPNALPTPPSAWTGFEGIMICLKDKVYHLQSHPQFAQGQGNGCLERQKHDLTTIANYTVSVAKVTSATCLYLRTYVSRRESITRVNRSKN
eukprot:g51496.t1